ncbi:hypothetical protein DLM45_06530 [Hyphomicrobium methylovorum]|nr:hypothetical protein [Hyphomicrobium methylovorum]
MGYSYKTTALILMLAFGGCSANSTPDFLKKPEDSVEAIEGQPTRKYKAIKELSVYRKRGHPQYAYVGKFDVARVMKRQALELGANAVINVKYQEEPLSFWSYGSITGTGLAVKYID